MLTLLVFNATFNNISVTLWWSDLTVGDPKYQDATTELELVNSKFNHSCIDYTSLQVAQLSLSYESIEYIYINKTIMRSRQQ